MNDVRNSADILILPLFLAAALLLGSCATPQPAPATSPPLATRSAQQQAYIDGAVDFLHGQHNAETSLLRESLWVAPQRQWLATDNRLAVYALRAAGEVELTQRLEASIERYGGARHGVIELLVGGEAAAWPPYTETQLIADGPSAGEICPQPEEAIDDVVCNETRLSGGQYAKDWMEYADFLLYGALAAAQQGGLAVAGEMHTASELHAQALALFDGQGFADKPFRCDGLHATYKLALALIVGEQLGQPVDERLVRALLSKQHESGGFYTLYREDGSLRKEDGELVSDPNVETTAYALLALLTLQ